MILVLLLMSMGVWAATWQQMDVNIIRDRQTLYRINHLGHTENTYVVKIRNKSLLTRTFSIDINGSDTIKLDKKYNVVIAPKDVAIIPIVATLIGRSTAEMQQIKLTIKTEVTGDSIEKPVSFYSGNKQ